MGKHLSWSEPIKVVFQQRRFLERSTKWYKRPVGVLLMLALFMFQWHLDGQKVPFIKMLMVALACSMALVYFLGFASLFNSKSIEFHDDSIRLNTGRRQKKIRYSEISECRIAPLGIHLPGINELQIHLYADKSQNIIIGKTVGMSEIQEFLKQKNILVQHFAEPNGISIVTNSELPPNAPSH